MARSQRTKRKADGKRAQKAKRWKESVQAKKEEKQRKKLGSDQGEGSGYKDIVKENQILEKYYKGLGIIPEVEWDLFMSMIKEDLPAAFRITGHRALAECVLNCLETKYFKQLCEVEVDGEKIPPPHSLPWYPGRLAWQVSLSRKFLRKSPLISKFHSFLVKENTQGSISRQEAVSMIPPLLLGVEPHHKVLDMCAAPGSKTAQLIEALHSADTHLVTVPSGVVVANDADNKRCYMLVHQAKRLNSPCFVVTNHDASVYPHLYYNENDKRIPLEYDHILCDVPCSGDGTIRKNPSIWRSWSPGNGNSLHKLQLRILTRGLELLVPGGRLVYSTCSLNPVEDEAVVAAAVTHGGGAVEIVQCSDQLPELKFSPGTSTWKVMNKSGEWIDPIKDSSSFQSTVFPPSAEQAEQLHLNRCIRILPHHQDTGGFFVAVLVKHSWLPWQHQAKKQPPSVPTASSECGEVEKDISDGAKQTEPAMSDAVAADRELQRPPEAVLGKPGFVQQKNRGRYKEDPYVFFDKQSDTIKNIESYYGVPSSFCYDQFLVRTNTGKKRNIYFTSKLVKELTISNNKDVRFINTGVRVLSRCDHVKGPCPFRLTQDGMETMIPHITKRVVSVTLSDIILVLSEPNPLTSRLSAAAREAIGHLDIGPAVFVYDPKNSCEEKETDQSLIPLQCPIYLSAWVAAWSVRLFLGQIERYHYLSVLGEDPPEDLSLTTTTGPAKKEMMADEEDCLMDIQVKREEQEEEQEQEQPKKERENELEDEEQEKKLEESLDLEDGHAFDGNGSQSDDM